jgi:hypothetical protein
MYKNKKTQNKGYEGLFNHSAFSFSCFLDHSRPKPPHAHAWWFATIGPALKNNSYDINSYDTEHCTCFCIHCISKRDNQLFIGIMMVPC